jgi:hypothetical protein
VTQNKTLADDSRHHDSNRLRTASAYFKRVVTPLVRQPHLHHHHGHPQHFSCGIFPVVQAFVVFIGAHAMSWAGVGSEWPPRRPREYPTPWANVGYEPITRICPTRLWPDFPCAASSEIKRHRTWRRDLLVYTVAGGSYGKKERLRGCAK